VQSKHAARRRRESDLILVRPWGSAVSFWVTVPSGAKIVSLTPHLWIILCGVRYDAWYNLKSEISRIFRALFLSRITLPCRIAADKFTKSYSRAEAPPVEC
jgi:hypothetical protein